MKTTILAILMFCVMIFPHELGHFIAAKICGVQVNEFAFGMGPVIWKKQRGETLHTIRLFPIGGFCAMEGEDGDLEVEDKKNKAKSENKNEIKNEKTNENIGENAAENIETEDGWKVVQLEECGENPRAFYNKKPLQKIFVLVAGSAMNMICAFLIMTLVVGIMGFTTTTIGEVTDGSPAFEAGIQAGDKILRMEYLDEKKEITKWSDVSQCIMQAHGSEITFTLKGKDGEEKEYYVTPTVIEKEVADGNIVTSYQVGIVSKKGHNPIKAVKSGYVSTVNMTKLMFTSLGQLFSGEATVNDMSGPVGMVQMVSETTNYGFWYYGFLVALICVNLAVINLLPLPALDGGRIIFVLFSWITGKKVPAKFESAVHFVGITLLLLLMLYVTGNDIFKLINLK